MSRPTPAATPSPTGAPTPAPTVAPATPTAAFTVKVDGLTVRLSNRSKGADSWAWTFGDGGASTARNPTHAYGGSGSYTIRLVVTSTGGGSDSVTHDVTVGP